jgi:hypothetical protein
VIILAVGFTILYMAAIYGAAYVFVDAKKDDDARELWLLARLPRSVAVLTTMLIHGVIDHISNLILLTWVVGIGLAFWMFGLSGAVVFIALTLGTVFLLLAYDSWTKYYEKIDSELPKREKKQDEEI